MAFRPEDRIKALLWCDRHCCLCGKQCGVAIELHHVRPKAKGGADTFENAIPLCFDCHCTVGHYHNAHSRGLKVSEGELKRRREQVYDRHTLKYVPPVLVRLTTQERTKYPDIGFVITHCSDHNPVSAFVTLIPQAAPKGISSRYYQGKRPWNLNPRASIYGHFLSPFSSTTAARYTIEIRVTLRDQVGRDHRLLPCAYSLNNVNEDWYLEPSPE